MRYKLRHHPYFTDKPIQGKYHILHKPHYKYAQITGYVRKHRYIMYIYLSILNNKPTYIEDFAVHHRNGDKKDNRIENLQLITNSDHSKLEKIKNYCGLCIYQRTMEHLFKNNIYYDLWYRDINGILCDDCKRGVEYFKKRWF